MNSNQRFSIMTFPQFFNGNELAVNIVVLPRDHNPLNPIIVGEEPAIPDSEVAFADAQFSFNAQLLPGFGANPLPLPQPAAAGIGLTTTPPQNPREIFEAMANHLQIYDVGMINSNINLTNIPVDRQFESARTADVTVKKYLPKTLRELPGFIPPRFSNAVTDDSYHCAVKGAKYYEGFTKSPDLISWGEVFAYILRQPQLARAAGFIYSTSIPIEADTFPDGGFLYVELSGNSSFFPQQNASADFARRYAARIPALIPGESRHVFAPLLYPVLAVHDGNYDQLFIETAENDDGFAKLVHSRQPPHRNLLEEAPDGSYPTKESGINLCWNEITILKWYVRQLAIDTSVSGPEKRIDAPIGVLGYHIDVRQTTAPGDPENAWESLNHVTSRQTLTLARDPNVPDDLIDLGDFDGELPYQVYPMQLDGTEQVTGVPQPYWLPMYFASWNGHSMILPDPDAAAIYQTTNPDLDGDPDNVPATDANTGDPVTTGTGVSGPAQNNLNNIYEAAPVNTVLRYGNNYQFRVRMQDLSGGAPDIQQGPINETPTDSTTCQFKRFIAPIQPRIQELEAVPGAGPGDTHPITGTDGPTGLSELNIRRPKLGYPAVVFTGKYTDPVGRLIAQSDLSLDVDPADHSHNAEHRVGLGIADPDVDAVEVVVEVASLKLDKRESVSGREDYIHLYTTKRYFPAIDGNDDNYEATLNIPISYRDIQGPDKVLNTGDELDLVQDLGLEDDIDNLDALILPTARTIRLTIRAVCEDKETDNETLHYYGVIKPSDKLLDVRYGEPFTIQLYSASLDESVLLVQAPGVAELQGIFMQPDADPVFDGKLSTLFFGKEISRAANIHQLAGQLNLRSSGLTLMAPKGERAVFGCSSRIRHTLAPDGSSLTFASKSDLYNHWLCCLSLVIDRDWMWDALETDGFIIRRSIKYTHSEDPESENVEVGRIKMIRTASFESLDHPQRNFTRLLFLDAVEPKKTRQGTDPVFPDTIDVTYLVEPQFRADHATEGSDEPATYAMTLPITTPPAQVPKIVSAGIALSPYIRDEEYTSSETRQRALWIEFDVPVEDPQDTVFARVIANVPDQLISNNHPELFVAPEEPPLPIPPEEFRVITGNSANDLAGLTAMQPMTKSTTSDRHYLLPVPSGLHANSDEMFGFFTYEFRIGHYERPGEEPGDLPEKVWTTAQGRYGRRLKTQGIQHPAPALNIMPNRDNEKLWITAPYAVAVHNGKNVTSDPPRTELWALLYAQVRQADREDYRNILLDDRPLSWRVRIETDKKTSVFDRYDQNQLHALTREFTKLEKEAFTLKESGNLLQLATSARVNKNSTKYGTTIWRNSSIRQLLALYGLPEDSPLSVIVVEVLPQINNIFEHITGLDQPDVAQATYALVHDDQKEAFVREYVSRYGRGRQPQESERGPSPVSDRLGHHRILRTSNLVKVPDICCTDC